MIRTAVTRWLYAPPISGRLALLWGCTAVALATLIRAAVQGVVDGCEFTPYLPFVLASAVVLRWWQAAVVALVSVAALGLMFMGPPEAFMTSSCFLSSSAIFLATSATIIGVVMLFRHVLWAVRSRGADEAQGGIVFSLDQGQVWASWYGQGPPVLLGSQKKVSLMMEDFLAQGEVAKRLNNRR